MNKWIAQLRSTAIITHPDNVIVKLPPMEERALVKEDKAASSTSEVKAADSTETERMETPARTRIEAPAWADDIDKDEHAGDAGG